jgi:hypothetical protein
MLETLPLFAGNIAELLRQFNDWAHEVVQIDRFWAPLSPTTCEQICGTISRLFAFAKVEKIDDAMQLQAIFNFAKDLVQKGRRNKYIADQVCPAFMCPITTLK